MEQNYLWKVEYEYDHPKNRFWNTTHMSPRPWEPGSKVFKNKLNAMNYASKLERDPRYRNVRFYKWK